jgi:DNA polymerase-3 subunit gamma/tau
MTYQVLARKWRPKQYQDVIGQEHVTKTLQNSVLNKQIGHAYLLTGTRGVGKTTIARIFAKSIRCENLLPDGNPCLKCGACASIEDTTSLDYIEIDGASNTGVDNIRELIENVQYLPTNGTHKVYVIDEVHMLSVNAFNALLKTLEEPPEHVVFIFATTDPQKLLGTVLSRVQRFDFKSVDLETLVSHIEKVSNAESIIFDDPGLIKELAKHGKGSVRDTLSLMDQIMSLSLDKNISEDVLLMSLGLAKTQSLSGLLRGIFEGDKEACVKAFKHVLDENIDLEKFVLQLLDALFDMIESLDNQNNVSVSIVDKSLIEKLSTSELLWIYEILAKDFEWAVKSLDPEKMIMFTFIKVALREQIINPAPLNINIESKKKEALQEFKQIEVIQEQNIETVRAKEEVKVVVPKTWENFLTFAMTQYKAIASNLERGNLIRKLDLKSESFIVELGISDTDKIFHEYLNTPENKEKVSEMLKGFFDKEDPIFRITLLDAEEKEKKNFSSIADIDEKKTKDIEDARRESIRTNKHIVEAEKLFNTKIDKVIINKV